MDKKILNDEELLNVSGGVWIDSDEWDSSNFKRHRGAHITKYQCGNYLGSKVFVRRDWGGQFTIAKLIDSYEKDLTLGLTERTHVILPENGKQCEVSGDDYTVYLYID